jgi:hypothetical protein
VSWNPRDHLTQRGAETTRPAAPPPETFDDTDPLPTYVSALDVDEEPTIPLWQRRALREQGLCLPEQLERWAKLLTRGITPV